MSSIKQWITLFSSAIPASEYNHKVSYHPVNPKISYSHVIVAICTFHVNISPRYPSTPSNHPMITVHLKVPYMLHSSNCPPIRVYDAVHIIDIRCPSTCEHSTMLSTRPSLDTKYLSTIEHSMPIIMSDHIISQTADFHVHIQIFKSCKM